MFCSSPFAVFFQAEDGIRYSSVTGVQTCALPIWSFFFSSRRRHTRFKCDWSSDVCSSDLVDLSYAYYKAIDLNAFQFAKELSQRSAGPSIDMRGGKRLTEQECRDDFVGSGAGRPALRATWCMRAYPEFEGLYHVTLPALPHAPDPKALAA